MNDCHNAAMRDQLPDLVHDRLSETSTAAVAAHVAMCAACAAEVALLRELRDALRSARAVDVARIVAALPMPPAVRDGGRVGRRRSYWRVAAAIAVLLVGGGSAAILSSRFREAGDDRRVQQVAAADLSIDADLGDASLIELEALLAELETFDGLPAGEPEPPPSLPAPGEEGL